jgi:hypothetical protein
MKRNKVEKKMTCTNQSSISKLDQCGIIWFFGGIQEERDEDCKQVLLDFLRNKMKIMDDISLDRIHRIGKPNEFSVNPRNIVAK